MPHYISAACSWPIPDYVSLAAAGLLSAIAAWVASKTRSTSEAVQSTLRDHEKIFEQLLERPVRSGSQQAARARRKSSTKGTTST